jgi:hypothetical protein
MTKQAEKVMAKEEPVEVDLIVQTAHEINALDKETALEVVPSLIESADFSYFKLGGVLSAIQENDWWQGEASSFKEFVPDNYGLHPRKANYLINIYNKLVEAEIPWHKVSDIGWTKLKELADILTNENVDEWVKIAHSMTTLNLIAAVKASKAGEAGLSTDGTTAPDTSGVTTITFKVHPDQKETIKEAVEQAMEDADTEFKGVALEAICMNFLAGGSTKEAPKPLSLQGTMEKYSYMQVLDAFEAIWPEVDIAVSVDEDDL